MTSIVPVDPVGTRVRNWRQVAADLWHVPTIRAQHCLQRASVVFCCVLVSALLNAGTVIDWRLFGLSVVIALGAIMLGQINDA